MVSKKIMSIEPWKVKNRIILHCVGSVYWEIAEGLLQRTTFRMRSYCGGQYFPCLINPWINMAHIVWNEYSIQSPYSQKAPVNKYHRFCSFWDRLLRDKVECVLRCRFSVYLSAWSIRRWNCQIVLWYRYQPIVNRFNPSIPVCE